VDVHGFSARLIDFAERLSNVADAARGRSTRTTSHGLSKSIVDFGDRLANVSDAAKGKGRGRVGSTSRWLLLPAAGAGLYAVARSEFVAKQTKEMVDEAKTLATELPNDLMNSVRQTSQASQRSGRSATRSSSSGRRRRTGSSTRKTKSASARPAGKERRSG
jgi:hypothetical protein